MPSTDVLRELIGVTLIDNNSRTSPSDIWRIEHQRSRFRKSPFTEKGLKSAECTPRKAYILTMNWNGKRETLSSRTRKTRLFFEQKNIEVPKTYSQSATNIIASKYFRGRIGTPEREESVREMIDRVAKTIATWGRHGGYFISETDASVFESELTSILVNQRAAFNSPVWFNVGIQKSPQCSACFINSVHDDMRSILGLAMTEGMLFKYGSGAGSNLSSLRSSKKKN